MSGVGILKGGSFCLSQGRQVWGVVNSLRLEEFKHRLGQKRDLLEVGGLTICPVRSFPLWRFCGFTVWLYFH